MAFSIKMISLKVMYNHTLKKSKELEEVSKKEKTEPNVLLKDTTRVWFETVAFFEAYLNAFYSLLQIIAKATPYFYEKEESETLRNIGKVSAIILGS